MLVGFRNTEEIGGLEARPANERAIDVLHTEQLDRVGRFDRPAVQNSHGPGLRAQLFAKLCADVRMGGRHVLRGRRQSGSDRPDRLVGNDGVGCRGACRHGTVDLPRKHTERLARLPLLIGFTDADDRDEAGAPGGFGLGADSRIIFPMVRAALRMADDHMACARIPEHLRRNVAGMGAAFFGMAVLAAGTNRGACQDPGRAGQKGCRHANQRFSLRIEPPHEAVADHPQLVEGGAGAVHLPVARDERSNSWRHGFMYLRQVPYVRPQ